jgi:hypothetical protein
MEEIDAQRLNNLSLFDSLIIKLGEFGSFDPTARTVYR